MTSLLQNYTASPPGPNGGLLGLKTLNAFQRDILGFTGQLAQYGDIATFKLGPIDAYMLSNPAHIYQVLVDEVDKFPRPDILKRVLGKMIGKGILLSDGPFWLQNRRLMQPAFHHKRIESYATTMVTQTERLLAKWHDGEQRNISTDMQRATLDIVAKTLFDTQDDTFADQIQSVSERLQADISERLRTPLDLDWLPTQKNKRYFQDLSVLDRLVRNIIAERRKDNVDHGDLLSMLLHSQDENGVGMSDQQVRDEALTLFLAGHDTTSLLMGWVFFQLAQHPEVKAKLHQELDQVLGSRTPTLADLPALKYTEQIVKEVLRLYPSAYFGSRQASEDVTIGDYRVKKGSQIFFLSYHVHRDPRYFSNPLKFMPERWNEGFEKALPKCAYFPFAAGPHICIGNQFALMEARLMLATIAQQWDMELLPGQDIHPVPFITLYPSNPIQMRVTHRRLAD